MRPCLKANNHTTRASSLEQTFLQRIHTADQWAMKWCSASFVSVEMQIRDTRSHFTHITVAKNRKKIERENLHKHGEVRTPHTAAGNVKEPRHCERLCGSSSNLKHRVTIWLRYALKRIENIFIQKLHVDAQSSAASNSPKGGPS